MLCSDDGCPCPGNRKLKPGGSGLLFISEDVVAMRGDALSWDELQRKLTAMSMQTKKRLFVGAGVVNPIFLCRQGARLRRLDLKVAAADAKHWFETGRCPL